MWNIVRLPSSASLASKLVGHISAFAIVAHRKTRITMNPETCLNNANLVLAGL
jgi:hypothetical protein